MELIPNEIHEYVKGHCSEEEPLFTELTEETQTGTPFPMMQSGHVEGLLLRMLVQISQAENVLEIGTFTGYSALSMAMGLPENGRLITCDVDPKATDIARRYWAKSPHGKKIDLRLAPALETLETLEGPFDLVFIDADKENYVHYWDACMPKVRQGGLLTVDNVLWSGRILDPQEPLDHAMVAFNEHVRKDERVETVMLTVRDGITVARKR